MFANFGADGTPTLAAGNLNGSAFIDAADAGVMFAAWTGDVGPPLATAGVPEPTTFALAALGLLVMGCRRRNRA